MSTSVHQPIQLYPFSETLPAPAILEYSVLPPVSGPSATSPAATSAGQETYRSPGRLIELEKPLNRANLAVAGPHPLGYKIASDVFAKWRGP